jgi:general secretion pathway protein K
VTTPPNRERGAALLSVLLLVAVMAVIAAVMLDRLGLATHLARNSQAMTQARLYATSAESLVIAKLRAGVAVDRNRTVDSSGLLGREITEALPHGTIRLRIEDGANCFNLNSLVENSLDRQRVARPQGLDQFIALAKTLGVAEGDARPLAASIADWIDDDQVPLPGGAEDDWYRAQPVPYRTAGRLIGDASETRAIKGMTPALFGRLRPWLCALPRPDLSPIDLNTLRADQVRLVALAFPGVPEQRLRALVARRPATGYTSAGEALAAAGLSGGTAGVQFTVASRWFTLDQTIVVGPITLHERALIDAGLDPPRVAFRSWGNPADE